MAARAWWSNPGEAAHRGVENSHSPGVKARGGGHLRLVCGPEYTAEDTSAGCAGVASGHIRALALREYALESEPVDPRL